MPQHSVYFTA